MRVLTWNLWWRFGPWEERRKAVLTVLRELRPDIVGLQEVWEHGGENLARWLADELGLHCAWGASDSPGRWQRRLGDPSVGIGNAVLSRWPVLESEVLRLSAPEELDDGRLALYARLDLPGHPVPFFTTHLASAAHASAVRCAQVTALARFVALHRGGTDFPPVVTGDFNARPESDEIRLLGGYLTAPAVPGQVLLDAWEHADPRAPSATRDAANPHVAAAFRPSIRVDYIRVGPPGPGGLGHVRSVRRAGDRPVDGVWPSDHTAVLADLADPADG
ncbi:endonuclease/exonuclease/phosphatase family protein [Streptomyces sp. TRM 70361]|uniref:endonuclease/exonuclease/phosphatase family protein n=1 Tax=Streptomyces sp. TRM 70361 TaxID=3116553 RepID=UPI002E7BC955|nr:endonuclease/exonuclease/phosphatase family protein [Streptomyces sp. TRM 70361]MEE1938245.1 endonuclease/exonuclease/phosphatase family protein [Streptomyces sp. TRM 70361]